jgi:sporulation protein YlmC with PRC-barrel domain
MRRLERAASIYFKRTQGGFSMMNRTLTAAALAVVLAAPAFAQTATPPAATAPAASKSSSMSPSADGAGFVSSQQTTDWRGSKLIGATVYGTDNASIGEINDLVIASDGKISAAVIGVGGFLGVATKNVAVPFEKLNVTRKADTAAIDKITVSFTKDELKNAPTYAFYEPAAKPSSTTGSATPERSRGISPTGSPSPSTPAK